MASIKGRIRNTRRYVQVLEVLARHGFASIVTETGLDRYIERGRDLFGLDPPETATTHLPTQVRLRMAMEELGPTYIKLGQILSTRPDLVTPPYAKEFKKLQSNAPFVPFERIREQLESEYGEKLKNVFDYVEEEPMAAASIAQTHRARLKGGNNVVLKILRPGIEQVVEADVAVMGEIGALVEAAVKDLGFSPTAVVLEFKRQLRRELNFLFEGRSIDRLYEAFRNDSRIHFTKVFWGASTKRVLAIEEVRGTMLSQLDSENLDPKVRRRIVEAGTDAVFRMCLEHGFFHADPHPGNIFHIGGGRICFIDLGMTGHLEESSQEKLADLVSAVVATDLNRVIRAVVALADADPSFETDREFRADVWDLVTRFHSGSLENLDITVVLNQFFELLQRWGIHIPADMVFLIKALTTIQGVGQELDPDFDFVARVRPMIRRLIVRRRDPKALLTRAIRAGEEYLDFLEDLPSELRFISAELRRRKFSIRLQLEQLPELKQSIYRSGKLIAIALVFAANIIGSSMMMMANPESTGFMLLGFAGVFGGYLFIVLTYLTIKRNKD